MSTEKLPPPSSILPSGKSEERPLFVIMTIMAFLASLTLLITLIGFRASQTWQTDLMKTATVQIYPKTEQNRQETLDIALKILQAELPNRVFTPVTETEAKGMLAPWIGDLSLPDDMPLPLLIRVTGKTNTAIDKSKLTSAFSEAGFDVEVDSHLQWGDDIQRTWAAARLGMMSIIIIVLLAGAATASFATQSVLRTRRNIIDVLAHVGAQDRFIIALFIRRFLVIGLKAAIIGAILAFIFLLIIAAVKGTLSQGLFPAMGLRMSDIFWLCVLTMIMGLISGGTAAITTVLDLKRNRATL